MEDLNKPLNEEELEKLYQSLRENEDHEEQLRRDIFNKKQDKKNKTRQENYRYLKSGY